MLIMRIRHSWPNKGETRADNCPVEFCSSLEMLQLPTAELGREPTLEESRVNVNNAICFESSRLFCSVSIWLQHTFRFRPSLVRHDELCSTFFTGHKLNDLKFINKWGLTMQKTTLNNAQVSQRIYNFGELLFHHLQLNNNPTSLQDSRNELANKALGLLPAPSFL